ncbi:SRPBCC family protein [Paenibacillus piri]|uniref:SRPBCC domain-containing protein n=1 Tax=Paenibacillus piri TaxID=2547395 RepID=A0A4R5KYP5_9BACL|nr:SRPBCC domain-containing protein [Paenibacillus piri]TDG00191.1 SRPBCC domain-containing protein [Paenibacillus piri]
MSHNDHAALPDIRRTILLNAPIQKVWDTVSTSEGIAAWFMPNDFQPVLGFEFSINAEQYGTSYCKVTELDPPYRLAFTWGKDWGISFDLKDVGGKTEFTLTHAGWGAEQTTEFGESHKVVRDRMDHGWEAFVLPRLAKLVEA